MRRLDQASSTQEEGAKQLVGALTNTKSPSISKRPVNGIERLKRPTTQTTKPYNATIATRRPKLEPVTSQRPTNNLTHDSYVTGDNAAAAPNLVKWPTRQTFGYQAKMQRNRSVSPVALCTGLLTRDAYPHIGWVA